MRRLILLFSMLGLFALAPTAQAAPGDIDCVPTTAPKAYILLFHGGGFYIGDPTMTADTCQGFAMNGYRARSVYYKLGDVAGAFRTVTSEVNEAKRTYPRLKLYTYGESAGGALALYPAARGQVAGAFAWAPVTQLTTGGCTVCPWSGMKNASSATRKSLSPYTLASAASSPIMVTQGTADTFVPASYAVALSKKWKKMTLSLRSGETHAVDQHSYLIAGIEALAWFNQQTKRRK